MQQQPPQSSLWLCPATVDGHVELVHSRVSISAAARKELLERVAMVRIVAHPLLFSHSATCMAEPTTHNITRNQFSHAHTSPYQLVLTRRSGLVVSKLSTWTKTAPLSAASVIQPHTSAPEPDTQEEMGILWMDNFWCDNSEVHMHESKVKRWYCNSSHNYGLTSCSLADSHACIQCPLLCHPIYRTVFTTWGPSLHTVSR